MLRWVVFLHLFSIQWLVIIDITVIGDDATHVSKTFKKEEKKKGVAKNTFKLFY